MKLKYFAAENAHDLFKQTEAFLGLFGPEEQVAVVSVAAIPGTVGSIEQWTAWVQYTEEPFAV